MRQSYFGIIFLCVSTAVLSSCTDESEQCEATANQLILGEWQGEVTQTFTRGEEITENRRTAKLRLRSDYTGELEEYVRSPFGGQGYIDTLYSDFTFSHLPQAAILDLVFTRIDEASSLSLNYSNAYNVLELSESRLRAYYFFRARDIDGNASNIDIEWDFTR